MKSIVTKKSKNSSQLTDVVSAIEQTLVQSRRVLVATHVDPDGDAIGTQLAFTAYLRDLGKEAWAVRQDDIPDKYLFLKGAEEVIHVSKLVDPIEFDTALILECPTRARVGEAARYLTDSITIVNIDHHPDNGLGGDVAWLEPTRSSVGEMAFEYFQSVGWSVTAPVAEQLFTAILTDTGRFRFSSTSPRTMQIAAELIELGADTKKITDLVYHNVAPPAMKLLGRVLNGIEYFDHENICFLTLTQDMLSETGARPADAEGLVDFTLISRGAIVGALVKERPDGTAKTSLRSRDGINVAKIAARFGGGGHFNAAGCTIPEPIDQAKMTLLNLFREARGRAD